MISAHPSYPNPTIAEALCEVHWQFPAGREWKSSLPGELFKHIQDEYPEMDARGPRTIGGSPVTLHVYVEDADAVFERAVQAGARPLRPVEDQFYGDRSGQFEDPFGHRWNVATHVEDVPPEEMAERARAVMAGG